MMNQYQAKYKMYIISHRSFVSGYEGYGHGKMSGKRYCEWGCLIRNYYGDIGLFGDPIYAIPFYSLYSDNSRYTSAVIDYKKTKDDIEFETMNSIYKVKELKKFDYINQLKEFDDYKKSEEYNKLFKFIEEEENKIMKNIMEGKE